MKNTAMMMNTIKKVHFVGIGGIGMSGIAEILLNQGFIISGYDIASSEITDRLSGLGIKIFEFQDVIGIENMMAYRMNRMSDYFINIWNYYG